MRKRQQRHDAIRDIIRTYPVRTQKDLAEQLRIAGYDCTQATISRDVLELGLVKAENGQYALPEEQRLARLVSDLVVSVQAACNLVVVKTSPGAAQGVSAALDAAALDGALGTVAGDDTIMIAAKSFEAAADIGAQIEALRLR
jgi:transcriptional regulator of arginine metabolism